MRGDEYRGFLQVGQKVYSGLYGGRYGRIAEIIGEQRPDTIKALGGGVVVMGGQAMISVVFDNGTVSRGIPEGIIRGVQWEIFDEVDQEAVSPALAVAEASEIVRKKAEEERVERLQKEREALPARFSKLETVKTSKKSPWALGAANIRRELKAAFQNVKFEVRSDSFSGGNSIDIYWTDGPTTEQVQKITSKYEEGSFNGMEDIYEYDRNNVFPDVFGGAKYVMEQRNNSDAAYNAVAVEMGYSEARFNPKTGTFDDLSYEIAEMIKRATWAKAF